MTDEVRENLEYLREHAQAALLKRLVEKLLEDDSLQAAPALRALLEEEPSESGEGQ